LRRQLNAVTGSALDSNGVYDDDARTALRDFQTVVGVAATGIADPVTRWILAEAAARVALSALAGGNGVGCEVAVIGDSLIAGNEDLHTDALAAVGCAAEVDGEGSRSLAYGWQCRIQRAGRPPQVELLDKRIRGNDTCEPSGLTLLASWASATALGSVVVVALGTNDSGLFDHARWEHNWAEALRLAGGRPVVFLTTQARAASAQRARQQNYSSALRQWCAGEELCVLADWANTPAAADPASYIDSVHLSVEGTRARAEFIADVIDALVSGQPIPNPQPPPPPTTTVPPTETTTTVPPTETTTTTTTTTTAPVEPPPGTGG
jgi:lysophospholipase L1-like esterase